MDDFINKLLVVMSVPIVMIMGLVFFLTMLCNNSAVGDNTVVAVVMFRVPFEDNVIYGRSSPYGYRIDPFSGKSTFHNGLDLTAPVGTNIIASADGIVENTGFETGGLGNYVYLKHDYNGATYYTAYGHMSDNSIVVTKGQTVKMGDKLGVIGTTGNSTGIHLHFMVMTPKLSYNKEYLVDPTLIVEALKK